MGVVAQPQYPRGDIGAYITSATWGLITSMKGEMKAHGHLPWMVYHGHVQMHRKFVRNSGGDVWAPPRCGHYKGGATGG